MHRSNYFLPSIIILILTFIGCNEQQSGEEKMQEFARDYTAAWNSKDPQKMASFYAEDGVLIVNEGTPARGREQLAKTAESYMLAFPDMELVMDSLVIDSETYKYYWTFKGTNTGPGGNGNRVNFSGFEEWSLNEDGLIQRSIGTYDLDDYLRQVRGE